MVTIDLTGSSHVINPMTGAPAQAVSSAMFGAIAININDTIDGVHFDQHFSEAYDYLSATHLRFPDGEMPDGFVYQDPSGEWKFAHNSLNGGADQSFFDPISQTLVDTSFNVTQSYLNSLTPAFSLKYDELLHDGLLDHPGRLTFSESLAKAVETGSSFALVIPEFEYLKTPHARQVYVDGSKETFHVADHVYQDEIKTDVETFLENLFLNGMYNDGILPNEITIEIGNEDYFGWNSAFFDADSTPDLDSYSAYAISVLEAVKDFRTEHPEIGFNVAMQAHGANYVAEIARNFSDAGVSDLFSHVNVIDAMHFGLDATVETARDLETNWTISSGADALMDLIEANGGDRNAVQLSMSAWSANSSDVSGFGNANHGLPAAGATLSLFSSLFELGFDSTANWGIAAWGGYGTNASRVDGGAVEYAPYIEAYRLMAESLAGTYQVETGLTDGSRSEDYQVYAYVDDAKGVFFAAANDFSGEAEIELSGFGEIQYAWLERISQTAGPDPTTIVTREQVELNGDIISFDFNTAYEVVRIIAARTNAGEGELHLWGFPNDEELRGGQSDDLIEGNAGQDTLHGGAGDDQIFGGSGHDFLYGNSGNDLLVGGAEKDVLHGGSGDDTLTGGGGPDEFQFSALLGTTTVTDFQSGLDQLNMSGVFPELSYIKITSAVGNWTAGDAGDTGGFSHTLELIDTNDGTLLVVTRTEDDAELLSINLSGISVSELLSNIETSLYLGSGVEITQESGLAFFCATPDQEAALPHAKGQPPQPIAMANESVGDSFFETPFAQQSSDKTLPLKGQPEAESGRPSSNQNSGANQEPDYAALLGNQSNQISEAGLFEKVSNNSLWATDGYDTYLDITSDIDDIFPDLHTVGSNNDLGGVVAAESGADLAYDAIEDAWGIGYNSEVEQIDLFSF